MMSQEASPAERDFRLWPSLGLLLLAWLILSWPWLSGHYTIPWDAKAHFQAQFQFLADSLHRGDSPFWNPYVFAGSPQIADPQSLIFSPPHLIAALLTPAPGFQLADGIVLAMLLAGGVGVVLIFRHRNWHWIGSLVAAIAFAFGGSAAWRVQHTGQISDAGLVSPRLLAADPRARSCIGPVGTLRRRRRGFHGARARSGRPALCLCARGIRRLACRHRPNVFASLRASSLPLAAASAGGMSSLPFR